ncbi:hypothetical protein BC629DRAFT_1434809 [Irpex lacteus]|nr:hypothetical protein BC629DRAFT_1434809 [Irpex lacteus]
MSSEKLASGMREFGSFRISPIFPPTTTTKFHDAFDIQPDCVFVSQPGHHGTSRTAIDLEKEPVNGGVLLKTIALSSDPYMRYRFREADEPMFCPPILLDDPVDNFGVGKVVRSEDPNFKSGDLVWGYFSASPCAFSLRRILGLPTKAPTRIDCPLRKIDPIPGLPLSVYLGPLGLIGSTVYGAWKAFLEEKVKESKALFVTSGAGGVGTFLIEYAKVAAPHLKIIASAGSDEKVEGLRKRGVVAFNYKTQDANEVLKKEGPIDIYWDNVGGPQLDAACSTSTTSVLSSHADASPLRRHFNFEQVFKRSITIHGFIAFSGAVAPPMATFAQDIGPLVATGKISGQWEHRFSGLKESVKALNAVHTGENKGKAVIVVMRERGRKESLVKYHWANYRGLSSISADEHGLLLLPNDFVANCSKLKGDLYRRWRSGGISQTSCAVYVVSILSDIPRSHDDPEPTGQAVDDRCTVNTLS